MIVHTQVRDRDTPGAFVCFTPVRKTANARSLLLGTLRHDNTNRLNGKVMLAVSGIITATIKGGIE